MTDTFGTSDASYLSIVNVCRHIKCGAKNNLKFLQTCRDKLNELPAVSRICECSFETIGKV